MKNIMGRVGLGLVAMSVALLGACGGGSDSGSGVDGDKKGADLTADEATALCEYGNGLFPTEPVECTDFTWDPATSLSDCSTAATDLPPDTCPATVSDYEACQEARAADVCATDLPAACAPLFAEGCISF